MDVYKIVAVHQGVAGMQDLMLVGVAGDAKDIARTLSLARSKEGFKRGTKFHVYNSVCGQNGERRPVAYSYNYNKCFYMDFPEIPLTDMAIKGFFKQVPGLRHGSLDSARMRVDMARALMARGNMPSWSACENLRRLLEFFLQDRRRSL